MKHLGFWLSSMLLLSAPLFVSPLHAQEEDFGDDGFQRADWGDSGEGERGGNQGQRAGVGRSPLEIVRDVLAAAGAPLSDDQQKAVQAAIDEQRAAAAASNAQPGSARPGGESQPRGPGDRQAQGTQQSRQQAPGGEAASPPAPGAGWQGARRGSEGQAPARPRGDALQEKVLALLTAQQQDIWKKYQRDQTMARGGFPALRLALEEAGTPPTPEQDRELQAQFRTYNQQQRDLRAAATPGAEPDAVKLKELENDHLTHLIKLLDPAQRKALLEWRRSTQKPAN